MCSFAHFGWITIRNVAKAKNPVNNNIKKLFINYFNKLFGFSASFRQTEGTSRFVIICVGQHYLHAALYVLRIIVSSNINNKAFFPGSTGKSILF